MSFGPTKLLNNTSYLMWSVFAAILPAFLMAIYFYGSGYLIQFILGAITIAIAEPILYKAINSKASIKQAIGCSFNGASFITLIILVLCLPPYLPFWVLPAAMIFCLIFGKYVYGGLGANLFNPAMLGFIFVLISFPLQINQTTNFSTAAQMNLQGLNNFKLAQEIIFNNKFLDEISGATSLNSLKTNSTSETLAAKPKPNAEQGLTDTLSASFKNSANVIINLLLIAGGLLLIAIRATSLFLPFSFFAGFIVSYGLFYWLGLAKLSLMEHFFTIQALLLAGFFVITDPVSAPANLLGKVIFGFVAGILTYIFRYYSSYPDGVAFVVLFMNMLVPMINLLTSFKSLKDF